MLDRRVLIAIALLVGITAVLFSPYTAPPDDEIPTTSPYDTIDANTSIEVTERITVQSGEQPYRGTLRYDAETRRAIVVSTLSQNETVTTYYEQPPNRTDAQRTYTRHQYATEDAYESDLEAYRTFDADAVVVGNDTERTIYRYAVENTSVSSLLTESRTIVGRGTETVLFNPVTQPRFERIETTERNNVTLAEYEVTNGWRSPTASPAQPSVMNADGTLLTSNGTGLREANLSYTLYGGNTAADYLGAKTGITDHIDVSLTYNATVTDQTVTCPAWAGTAGPTPECRRS